MLKELVPEPTEAELREPRVAIGSELFCRFVPHEHRVGLEAPERGQGTGERRLAPCFEVQEVRAVRFDDDRRPQRVALDEGDAGQSSFR